MRSTTKWVLAGTLVASLAVSAAAGTAGAQEEDPPVDFEVTATAPAPAPRPGPTVVAGGAPAGPGAGNPPLATDVTNSEEVAQLLADSVAAKSSLAPGTPVAAAAPRWTNQTCPTHVGPLASPPDDEDRAFAEFVLVAGNYGGVPGYKCVVPLRLGKSGKNGAFGLLHLLQRDGQVGFHRWDKFAHSAAVAAINLPGVQVHPKSPEFWVYAAPRLDVPGHIQCVFIDTKPYGAYPFKGIVTSFHQPGVLPADCIGPMP